MKYDILCSCLMACITYNFLLCTPSICAHWCYKCYLDQCIYFLISSSSKPPAVHTALLEGIN